MLTYRALGYSQYVYHTVLRRILAVEFRILRGTACCTTEHHQLASPAFSDRFAHNDLDMADPLSIAASIAGLLKLGTDVGVGLAKFCSAARAAPSLLKEVSEGLPLLCGALRRLEVLLPELQMSAVDLESLERLLKQCNGSLCELKTVVGTLQSTFDKGGHQKMWLQATWPAKEEEISSLWAKLSDYKSTLALTLQVQQA